MGAYLGVSAASDLEPQFIHLTYKNGGDDVPKVLGRWSILLYTDRRMETGVQGWIASGITFQSFDSRQSYVVAL